MRLFGELTKIEEQPDGTLKVYGVASTGARDDAGEVVLPAAMKAALPDYARYPALREMHQPTAAGRTLEATVDEDGATRIVAQVVDPVAIAKVKSRTYSGFSIGGRVIARDPADATIITKIAVAALTARVALLEGQMRALDELKLDVARLETRLDALIEHVRDLAASIRWMREPSGRRSARTPG